LERRLENGDEPINPLDSAAKEHDLFYSQYKDTYSRNQADKILEKKALKRIFSRDASLGERSVALLTAGTMRVKRKLGMGLIAKKKKNSIGRKKGTKKKITGKGLPFKTAVKTAQLAVKKNARNAGLHDATTMALAAVLRKLKKQKRIVKVPRVIPIPKSGGALPLIPILAGISALGGAASGVSSIIKAISEIIDAKKKFSGERKQVGNGLYLAPYKKNGFGLYLTPYYYSKN
jgi:hypothetical protein